jgi:hypothetical protein
LPQLLGRQISHRREEQDLYAQLLNPARMYS